MSGSAPRPESGCHDSAFQLHLAHGRRRMLRARDHNDRTRAAMAILQQELARLRGEWSPEDPSEWDEPDGHGDRVDAEEVGHVGLRATVEDLANGHLATGFLVGGGEFRRGGIHGAKYDTGATSR